MKKGLERKEVEQGRRREVKEMTAGGEEKGEGGLRGEERKEWRHKDGGVTGEKRVVSATTSRHARDLLTIA